MPSDEDVTELSPRARIEPQPEAAKSKAKDPGFRLMDLPDELISLVCEFIALQRYQYSQSRRPKPSPLFTLAHSHSKLAPFAVPLLHRRRQLDLDRPQLLTDHVRCLQLQLWPLGGPLLRTLRFARCQTVEVSWGRTRSPRRAVNPLPLALETCPAMTRLELRRPEGAVPRALATGFASLRAVAAWFPAPEWLAFLTALPQATSLAVFARDDTPPLEEWCSHGLWQRADSFSYETPPYRPTPQSDAHPLASALSKLTLPNSAKLKHLTLSVRLQLETAPLRNDFAAVVPHLHPFATAALVSLTLDDYILTTPASVQALAALFPSLHQLALGSRTMWSGPAPSHFAALAGFAELRSLECPRWPETTEPWREPEAVLAELAGHLPRLELVGLGGQQSEDQWYRITKGWTGGDGVRVERITIHDTNLDQGR